ncbi:MAG TPA: hypothetical protein VG408_03875 [Actinomycetota bacterium]|nr:hypothetical protein [Actinomycetota bacterium]
MSRRTGFLALATALLVLPTAVGARPTVQDPHSDNIKQIARGPIRLPGDAGVADGSDLAFQGDLIVAGSYSGTSFFKILKGAPYIKQIGFHNCPGGQGDVSVYKNLAFVSLDSPQSSQAIGCSEPSAKASAGKEGVRILDISDPTKPVQVNFVETDCGSHTHVINPHGDKVYIYNQSYPLSVPSPTCSVVTHRKVQIIEVDVDAPEKAKIVNDLDVSPEIGCHDVTIFPDGKLAAAACIGESQIWDVSDPAAPVIISRIVNPSIEIHHGTGVTWDQKYLAIADEFAGSVTGECAGDQHSPVGAMWFYDISDPTSPIPAGYYNVPRGARPDTPNEAAYMACTTHNFNILPMKHEAHYVAAVGYRSAGLSIVDFSDPSAPKEIAYYHQLEEGAIPDVWSGYWYNGRIYTNDNGASRGLSVYELKGTSAADVRFFRERLNPQVQIPDFR